MRTFFKNTVCALLVATSSASALAQDNAPRALSPRTLTPPEVSEKVPNVTPLEVKSFSGGIDVQQLGSVSNEALGVLSGSNAFPSDMWKGVNRGLVENLIASLPAQPSSPYLRILQRRLLLTAAQPPKGKSGEKSLLALRVAKLAEMGQTDDVIALIKAAPQEERDNDLAILETEALLTSQKTTQACGNAASNIQSSQDPFWIKTLAFCRMMAKQGDQAMLSLSLLKEMGDTDPVYYSLMDALQLGQRGKVDSLPAPKALDIALINASKAKLNEDIRNTNDPLLLSYLTKAGDIQAVQKAVEYNLVSVDFLAQAFKATKFDATDLDNAIASAEKLEPFKAQALLYQVSSKENQLPAIRAEAISVALNLATKNDKLFSIARLYGPMIADMGRSIDMLWFAPQALRALLASGDWDTAKAWYLLLRNAAFTDQEAARDWTAVRPIAAFAGFDVSTEATSQSLNNWWAAQDETPQSFTMATRLFSISDGLGLEIPDKLWTTLIAGPKLNAGVTPQSGIWIKMNKAAVAGRVGETVLMALHGLGRQKTNQLNATFLRDSLFALRMVGLERDARALAVETALQAGL
ncbi:MAG: hypothetical protein HWE34_00525 [Methylocystaceae bacterium]|nr:hypothetical protein [Methylocystaceae bacterium]